MNVYHESWKPLFNKYNFDVDKLYNVTEIIYPQKEHLFRVFEMDVKDIKILLLGQDPYHGSGQAHGLSFSVPFGITIPPTLKNIYKELQNTFPNRNYVFNSGNLERWFYKEKIFLLNASLSVIKGKPRSQMNLWKEFTNDVIKFVSENNDKCVFLLLGKFAHSKEIWIQNKDRVIKGVHPSPMASKYGFLGSKVFLKIEKVLGEEIDWSI